MPQGIGYRSNPYQRTPLSNNPYLSSVMQGIDMTVQLAREEQERARQKEQDQMKQEQTQAKEKSTRKFGLLSSIIGSKDSTPETKMTASDTFFKMLENPDMDLSDFSPEFKGDKPKEPEQTHRISERASKIFPGFRDKDVPIDVWKTLETQATEIWKAGLPKKATGTGGLMFNFNGRQLPAKPRLDRLADNKKRAVAILRGGIQAEGAGGYKIGKNEALMSQYIQTIEDLEQKLQEDQWTDQDEQIYQALQSPEQTNVNDEKKTDEFNTFRDSQLKFQQTMDEIIGN